MVIELKGVNKVFPAVWKPLAWTIGALFREHRNTIPQTALRGVDLHIAQGTILGLLGPHGSGKSTVLRIVAGLLSPTSGSVRVAGLDPLKQRQALLGQIGFIARDRLSFNGHLSGYENLRFFAGLSGILPHQQHKRVTELLDSMGLASVASRPYKTYSSDTSQRLAIARALLTAPEILIMDEPTGGLTPEQRSNFYGFLLDYVTRNNCTVLYATHNLNEAQFLCRTIALMDQGRVVAKGDYFEVQKAAEEVFGRLEEGARREQIYPGLARYKGSARSTLGNW